MRTRHVVAVAIAAGVAAASGIAYAAGFGVGSAHLGTATPPPPKFYPLSLTTANGGKTAGKLENTDTLTVTYNGEVQASTMCGGAANFTGTQTLTGVTVAVANNAAANGDDELTVSAVPTTACTGGVLHFGTVDLGSAAFVAANGTFTSSKLALTLSTTSSTLQITLGGATGTFATVSTATTAVYTPDTALTDVSGNAIGANTALSTTTKQF